MAPGTNDKRCSFTTPSTVEDRTPPEETSVLAHVNDVQHLHPHAAGMPWELLAVFGAATVVAGLALGRRLARRKDALVEVPQP